MRTLNEWLQNIEQENRKVLCFGTGIMAEEALQYDIIREAVVCMVDNDGKKQNGRVKLAGAFYPVIAPERLPEYLTGNEIILLTSGHYKSMRKQLEEMKLPLGVELVDFPEVRVAYTADSEDFFEERLLKECIREYGIVLEQYDISGEERACRMREKEAYIRGKGKDERPFVVPRIMIMPTTRCNMRCKGCSSLLPLFEKPCDVKIEQILQDFKLFFSGVDECIRITVGGEPFLYPNLKEILEYLLEQKKLLGIMLITNGTIVPKPEVIELLKNPKILVEVSDYGHLDKMSRLIQVLEESDVVFKVLTNQVWTDMGGVQERCRTPEEIRFTYLNCEQSKVIKGFHNGWFYTCARSARMTALGAYKSEYDRFELREEDTSEEIRRKLKSMFYSERADACNYCDLGVLPARMIEAGIQMQGNTKKSRYTIVDRKEYEELKRFSRYRGQ